MQWIVWGTIGLFLADPPLNFSPMAYTIANAAPLPPPPVTSDLQATFILSPSHPVPVATEACRQHGEEVHDAAVQSQKAVSAYFTSKQTLHFGFAEQSVCTGVPADTRL